jgi:hypothetical protein
MKRYIIIGALLVSAITQAHAKLGATPAQSAEAYVNEVAVICSYSKTDSTSLTENDANQLDNVNIPGVYAKDGAMVESGSSYFTQWDSFDGKVALLSGTLAVGKEWLSTRMYINEVGAKLILSGGLNWLKNYDMPKNELPI